MFLVYVQIWNKVIEKLFHIIKDRSYYISIRISITLHNAVNNLTIFIIPWKKQQAYMYFTIFTRLITIFIDFADLSYLSFSLPIDLSHSSDLKLYRIKVLCNAYCLIFRQQMLPSLAVLKHICIVSDIHLYTVSTQTIIELNTVRRQRECIYLQNCITFRPKKNLNNYISMFYATEDNIANKCNRI